MPQGAVIHEVEAAQVATTWHVMHQLRPHLDLEQYFYERETFKKTAFHFTRSVKGSA